MRILIFSIGLFACTGSFAKNIVMDFPELLYTIDNPIIKDGSYASTGIFKDRKNAVSLTYGYQTVTAKKWCKSMAKKQKT